MITLKQELRNAELINKSIEEEKRIKAVKELKESVKKERKNGIRM